MTKYNKLIRDRIPAKMDEKGVKYTIHKADDAEYAAKLREKLSEEVQEYLMDTNTEELADILEVVYALGELHNTSIESLEQLRKQKSLLRGGFKERLILDETE